MKTVPERLEALRQEMRKADVQGYIVVTSDFHDTEYVSEYFASRKYLSGFTGSQGTLAVLMDKAALWADGRYFIQAENELKGSGIELMRMGQKDVPKLIEWLEANLHEGECVGFDGRCVSHKLAREWKNRLSLKGIATNPHLDLVSPIWPDRPALQATPTFHYDEKYCGKSVGEKLKDVREKMKEAGAVHHIITKIDEIAWLYNLRANDILHFPAALSYTILSDDGGVLYIDDSRLDPVSRQILEENQIEIKDYEAIYEDVKNLEGTILLQSSFVNTALASCLDAEKIIDEEDPVILMKAIKNETELENTRNAHIKDGAAMVKFMYWLKHHVKDGNLSELSAQEYLQERRKEQPLYLEDSFETISAYKDHAAMMHYSSSPATDVQLKPEGMLLVDSGGHYLDGTTDITRTFVLGPISEEEKFWFTKALQSHIDLQMATFLYGCAGLSLDVLAREPLWKLNMDYQCGTGHGVGHLLNVHEAPNGFRWQIVPERNDSKVLEAGMIQSNEPGVYEAGKFGIRHENELIVKKGTENKYGQFMEFENLTFVPFDREGIDTALLSQEELDWLNAYHKEVYEKISPLLSTEEADWLQTITAPIA